MRWNLSPTTTALINLLVAVIAGAVVATQREAVEGLLAFAAVAVAGLVDAALVAPRMRRARREPLLSIWDFAGFPFDLVAVACLAYGLQDLTLASAAGFGLVLAVLDIGPNASSRRRLAQGEADQTPRAASV